MDSQDTYWQDRAALEWQVELGVTDAILDAPVDRYAPERGSREHFAVVRAEVTAIDWLELHADGHRRARFDNDGATWLTP